MVRQQSKKSTVLLPCSYFFPDVLSAFQQDAGLTLRSVLGACFSRSSFLRITFCKDIALLFYCFSQYSHRANRMPCQSVPHVHKSPVLCFSEEVYFCHKRNKTKQRKLMLRCCLDDVLLFEEDRCTKKRSTKSCLLSVLLLFKYEMLPGSIFVLPIDSPLFTLAFQKRRYHFTPPLLTLCRVMYTWKQMYVRSDCSELLFIACHVYKLN